MSNKNPEKSPELKLSYRMVIPKILLAVVTISFIYLVELICPKLRFTNEIKTSDVQQAKSQIFVNLVCKYSKIIARNNPNLTEQLGQIKTRLHTIRSGGIIKSSELIHKILSEKNSKSIVKINIHHKASDELYKYALKQVWSKAESESIFEHESEHIKLILEFANKYNISNDFNIYYIILQELNNGKPLYYPAIESDLLRSVIINKKNYPEIFESDKSFNSLYLDFYNTTLRVTNPSASDKILL